VIIQSNGESWESKVEWEYRERIERKTQDLFQSQICHFDTIRTAHPQNVIASGARVSFCPIPHPVRKEKIRKHT
jgi:hypothetical protein